MTVRLPQAPMRYDPHDQQRMRSQVEQEVGRVRSYFPIQPVAPATLPNSGTAATATWSAARPFLQLPLTGNATVTIAGLIPGAALRVQVLTGAGAHTVTWALASGLGSLRWFGGSAPTVTATASKIDEFEFVFNGTDTIARVIGQNA